MKQHPLRIANRDSSNHFHLIVGPEHRLRWSNETERAWIVDFQEKFNLNSYKDKTLLGIVPDPLWNEFDRFVGMVFGWLDWYKILIVGETVICVWTLSRHHFTKNETMIRDMRKEFEMGLKPFVPYEFPEGPIDTTKNYQATNHCVNELLKNIINPKKKSIVSR